MEKGLDTIIKDDGALSQGQKQLLCVARLMLVNPPLLILDEATSSIDTRTEMKIQDAFQAVMKGKTSFVVAHRLSTIVNSDLILVMNKGNVIEKGTHEELLEKHGFYYELYNAQFNH
jgi:ATP-binding cassette subfamily B protein